MIFRTVSFAEMQAQRRWKVEFFCAERGSKCSSYPLVALREVLDERKEFLDPQQYPDHTINYIGLEHIESVTGDLIEAYSPRLGREVLSRSKVFRKGDILYGRLRPALNKVFAADDSLPEGICSGEFYVLIPNVRKLTQHFARALLASRFVQEFVKGMTTGSALPRLQVGDLLDTEIPLPPLAKQQEYESMLHEQQARRKTLRTEMVHGPSAMLDSLANALELGTEPEFNPRSLERTTEFDKHRLPTANTIGRRRGRPTKDHRQLVLEIAE